MLQSVGYVTMHEFPWIDNSRYLLLMFNLGIHVSKLGRGRVGEPGSWEGQSWWRPPPHRTTLSSSLTLWERETIRWTWSLERKSGIKNMDVWVQRQSVPFLDYIVTNLKRRFGYEESLFPWSTVTDKLVEDERYWKEGARSVTTTYAFRALCE